MLILFKMDLFGAAYRWEPKSPPPSPIQNLLHIFDIDETQHSYTLPKETPKNRHLN